MANEFHLSVLTPERSVLEQNVTYVHVPGLAGYFGVLANHAPIIAALGPGKFTVRDAEEREVDYALSGGFFEMSENRAVVLADAMERCAEIDRERARAAEQRARDRLARAAQDATIDAVRAEAALRRALNRIKLAD